MGHLSLSQKQSVFNMTVRDLYPIDAYDIALCLMHNLRDIHTGFKVYINVQFYRDLSSPGMRDTIMNNTAMMHLIQH